MSKSFDEWLAEWPHVKFDMPQEAARDAWDHQQARIDELESQLDVLHKISEIAECSVAEMLTSIGTILAAEQFGNALQEDKG